jgi:uncharacterized protein DUF3592
MKPTDSDKAQADADDVESDADEDLSMEDQDGGTKAGGISSEPPPWAIILIVGTFFGGFILLSLAPASWGLTSTVGVISIFAAPMVVMVLAMLANKLWLARRASVWPQTQGRIVKSEVAATHHQFSGEATEVKNEPAIAYEYSVAGKTLTGTRISIGEDSGGANTEATLAHYPVGAVVMVYYDPKKPEDCLLERDVPKDLAQGCALLLAIGAAVVAAGYWLIVYAPSFIQPYVKEDSAGVVLFASGFGLVVLLMFLAVRREAKAAADWPTVRGKIMESGTESYRTTINKRRVTLYTAVVEYAYTVHGHDFRSRKIQLNESSGGSEASAQAVAARYPKGGPVEVHYDPANPSHAALELSSGSSWILLAVAGVCFAVAAYAGGAFG